MGQENTKTFQVRLSKELWEAFYKAFPGTGERKLLLERVIELLVERADGRDAFIQYVLDEAKERYGEEEER